MKNKRVLVISDLHAPYMHPDTVAFLALIKKTYKPDCVISVGDEIDSHAMSFHDSDPDLPSAGLELDEAIEALEPIYKLFPKVQLVSSNHGDMLYRKGKHHGIPRKYLRDYGDVLRAPKGWTWSNDLVLPLSDGTKVYVHHGLSKNAISVAIGMGMNHVSGHYHNDFKIAYSSTPEKLLWGMTVGCLIDDESLAFAYNKNTMGRPIIGCGIIIDGQPKLLPMVLAKGGRWIGKLR